MGDLASITDIIAGALRAWRPPPRLSLSEWADANFVLSAESSAEAGRWTSIPYQRGILDAFTDPEVEQVWVMKSARVGWTKIVNILVAYCIVQDPCPIMVVQPSLEDANGYSKEEIAPMIRDVPAIAAVISDPSMQDAGQTILHKQFPGGSITVVGANSGRGFRRVSRRIVLFDEVDGYPPSAGTEGDQIKLGIKRTEYYWDRKIGGGSTPLVAGASRIEDQFEAGDQRRYFVPCPHCGHMAPLVFRGDGGHAMKWPEGKPKEAFFACQKNGCVIEHHEKRGMVEKGEWRAAKPFEGKASFHIWAAYSYSPNATWGHIAQEFLEATVAGVEELKTFVNTTLGETWHEKGEAPEWERLYERREQYARGVPPPEALIVTCGVDVQRDRLIWEVVAWGADKQSWSVDTGVIPGDTSSEDSEPWQELGQLLSQVWRGSDGRDHHIAMMAVDSGDQTNTVYNWTRRHPMNRVIAVKGVPTTRTIIGAPKSVDVTVSGRRLARGYKVWPVGIDIAKGELYGWLRQKKPTEESGLPFPPGYCHFPEYGEDYFKEITAEHLVKVVKRTGFVHQEWQVIPGRENHRLDCRVYARAAAMLVGLDRRAKVKPKADAAMQRTAEVLQRAAEQAARREQDPTPEAIPLTRPTPAPPRGTWLRGRRGAISGGGSWLGGRR